MSSRTGWTSLERPLAPCHGGRLSTGSGRLLPIMRMRWPKEGDGVLLRSDDGPVIVVVEP
jgi:hypothetical protein